MMIVAEYLATMFLPALLAGLGCSVAWRFVSPGRLRTNLQVVGSLLFFVPQPLVLLFLNQSMVLLVYQEAVFAFWMLGIAGLSVWRLWPGHGRVETRESSRRFRAPSRRSPAVFAILALAMGAFGLRFAWQFVADVFLPRTAVEGSVEALKPDYRGRVPRLWDIVIGGRSYKATHDVRYRLKPGDWVQVEIGAGSHALLAIHATDGDRVKREPTIR